MRNRGKYKTGRSMFWSFCKANPDRSVLTAALIFLSVCDFRDQLTRRQRRGLDRHIQRARNA